MSHATGDNKDGDNRTTRSVEMAGSGRHPKSSHEMDFALDIKIKAATWPAAPLVSYHTVGATVSSTALGCSTAQLSRFPKQLAPSLQGVSHTPQWSWGTVTLDIKLIKFFEFYGILQKVKSSEMMCSNKVFLLETRATNTGQH